MFERVLVGVDVFSPIADRLVEWLPVLKKVGTREVVLLYVIPSSLVDHLAEIPVDKIVGEHTRRAEEKYREYKAFLEREGFTVETLKPVVGEPAAVLASKAVEAGAGSVVVASRGRGWLRSLLLGSVAEELAYVSKKPVMVVKGAVRKVDGEKRVVKPPDPFTGPLLAALDLHETSEKVYACARDIALKTGQRVVLLHILEEDEEPETVIDQLDRYERALKARGVEAEAILLEPPKPPARMILYYIERLGATLAILGPHGKGGSILRGLLLGRTVDIVLRYSPATVIVCK